MGKLRNLEIYFDENKTVYFPGDPISGYVLIESRGEIKINALKVFIRGIAKVDWQENKSGGYRLGSFTEHYRSEIEYCNLKQTLVGGKDSNVLRDVICDGRHLFPFCFSLPRSGLVTSFEGRHGSIRYYLKAELDKPWTLNHKVKKLFTVITPVDINEDEYLTSVEDDACKTLCCWVFSSGPVKLQARTDRRGYCPGESVILNALFENNGNRNVIPQASLYQIQTFNANGKRIIATNKLNTITGSQINARSTNRWNAVWLKIPAVSPSIISVLIRVEYFIKVSLLIPGSYTLSCVLPIVIGTVPFRGNLSRGYICQMLPTEFPQYARESNDPPPPYSECASLEEDFDEPINENFSPYVPYVTEYLPPPSYLEYSESCTASRTM